MYTCVSVCVCTHIHIPHIYIDLFSNLCDSKDISILLFLYCITTLSCVYVYMCFVCI